MCILIFKPQGVKLPSKHNFNNCALRNPDGFGFATQGGIFKTICYEEFLDESNQIKIDEPAIIHFRLATHGSICQQNSHPFQDDRSGLSFAHNGILNIKPKDDMTDSETAFRFILMPIIENYGLFSKEVTMVVNEIIGYSKFAFLEKDGSFRLFGEFINQSGLFYSNYSFLAYNNIQYRTIGRNFNYKK